MTMFGSVRAEDTIPRYCSKRGADDTSRSKAPSYAGNTSIILA